MLIFAHFPQVGICWTVSWLASSDRNPLLIGWTIPVLSTIPSKSKSIKSIRNRNFKTHLSLGCCSLDVNNETCHVTRDTHVTAILYFIGLTTTWQQSFISLVPMIILLVYVVTIHVLKHTCILHTISCVMCTIPFYNNYLPYCTVLPQSWSSTFNILAWIWI